MGNAPQASGRGKVGHRALTPAIIFEDSELNIRQEKYKANRIMGMNPLNAAVAAGYSENYAKQACRIERLVNVSISDELERAGLTAKVQAKALFELTQAKKNQICDIYVQKDKKGKWVINHNMSQFIEVEDNSTRLKTWEHIAELKKQTSNTLIDQSQHHTLQIVNYGEKKPEYTNTVRNIPAA